MKKLWKRLGWTLLCGPLMVGSTSMAAGAKVQGLDDENRIPGQYIVVLHEDESVRAFGHDWTREFVRERSQRLSERFNARVFQRYHGSVKGFAVRMNDRMAERLANDPSVAFVEADRIIHLSGIQDNAPWGLDRIDSRSGLDGVYEYSHTGFGVHAYVIDTGIRSTHDDFTGRMGKGFSSITDGRGTEDCNGHGTHVAGTVGGTLYGVAKEVTLYPVRVFGCGGSTTNAAILAGIDWVTENAQHPAVVNMSLGGGRSQALDNAVKRMVDAGIVTVVAAGNDNRNACNYSPAAVPEAITVGSTTNRDQRSNFSNFGNCVDIFAPGTGVLSAWSNNDRASRSISGTSMSSPHVAGAAALVLEVYPEASPAEVGRMLAIHASQGTISNVGNGSPNLLLYTGFLDGDDPGPIPEPEPEPEPNPENPCGPDCAVIEGQLSAGQSAEIGDSFQGSGLIVGYLVAPEGAEFHLYLQNRHWLWGWQTVASSTATGSVQELRFDGSNGTYRWLAEAASGFGPFSFYTP